MYSPTLAYVFPRQEEKAANSGAYHYEFVRLCVAINKD